MHDVLGLGTVAGYCTNVHAGATYQETLANLRRYALRVKARVSPGAPMGVGLWLSAEAARQLLEQTRVEEFSAWLRDHGLVPFTLNGFPYGNFHEPVVKHKVYEPDWADEKRLSYTLDLISILAKLLPEGGEGSISTLPVGWRAALRDSPVALERAAQNLCRIAGDLSVVEQETGRLIHLDLEPEPGCYLDTADDVVDFFTRRLFPRADPARLCRHLRVCHDICHAAVMFQNQTEALRRYRQAGIGVGKVQISSAVRVPFHELNADERHAALEQLSQFAEDRYLHQTVATPAGGVAPFFFDDLPGALASARQDTGPRTEWCTHFHVPLTLDRFGLLETTQGQVQECLSVVGELTDTRHFEVETYAWSVLPPALRPDDLAEGISRELLWLREHALAGSGR